MLVVRPSSVTAVLGALLLASCAAEIPAPDQGDRGGRAAGGGGSSPDEPGVAPAPDNGSPPGALPGTPPGTTPLPPPPPGVEQPSVPPGYLPPPPSCTQAAGPAPARRLTLVEYDNTIRALLGETA